MLKLSDESKIDSFKFLWIHPDILVVVVFVPNCDSLIFFFFCNGTLGIRKQQLYIESKVKFKKCKDIEKATSSLCFLKKFSSSSPTIEYFFASNFLSLSFTISIIWEEETTAIFEDDRKRTLTHSHHPDELIVIVICESITIATNIYFIVNFREFFFGKTENIILFSCYHCVARF